MKRRDRFSPFLRIGSMKINKYPDGASYVNNVGTEHQTFALKSYEDLWHLAQYVDAFTSQHNFKPRITISHLIDAQADRRFNKGESSGLKLVCKFLNSLDVKKYFVFHPHNAEVIEALLDNVQIIDNSQFIKSVLFNKFGRTVNNHAPDNKLILMSSDAGGFKPLMKLCDSIKWEGETYSASKSRDHETHKLTQLVDRQDFGGKDILIVDDLCVYGGTFKGLAKMLRERNCGKLYLAVSHMTVQDLGNDPVTDYFDGVYTTNSKYDIYKAKEGYCGELNVLKTFYYDVISK